MKNLASQADIQGKKLTNRTSRKTLVKKLKAANQPRSAIPMKGPLQIMKKAMRKNSDSFLQSSVQSVQRHNPAEFVNRLKDKML